MSDYQDLFMRTTLNDNGSIPAPAYAYLSPDIINHPQVKNPQIFFTQNYNSDPNHPLEFGEYNYIYVRAKNLFSQNAWGRIKCYWSKSSLLMHPRDWKHQKLKTLGEDDFVNLSTVESQGISVAKEPFVWSPPEFCGNGSFHYCFIGQVITDSHPNDIPEDFDKWDNYVLWVRNNPAICWRNLEIVDKHKNPQWHRLKEFSNIESKEAVVVFWVTCTNLPKGTTVRLKCDPLNIDQSEEINQLSEQFSESAICPGNFSGSLESMAFLPSGQSSWPVDAEIVVKYYVSQDSSSRCAPYAEDWSKFKGTRFRDISSRRDGFLVQVGNYSALFR